MIDFVLIEQTKETFKTIQYFTIILCILLFSNYPIIRLLQIYYEPTM